MHLLSLALTVYALLYLWFRTSFLIEYAQLVGLAGVLRVGEWQEEKGPYTAFLRSRLGMAGEGAPLWRVLLSFSVRMITCPSCAGFWLAAAVSLLGGDWRDILPVYALAMILFLRA